MTNDSATKRNPYINGEGEPELCQSITAFVDILGFKYLVKNARKEKNSQALFMDFHRVLSTWFNREEDFWSCMNEMSIIGSQKDSFKIRIFTDCILIGCPIREKPHPWFSEGLKELNDVLILLEMFQMEMTSNGYFVRGAITVDELYMDDKIIYGNGVIEAYEAESKKAKYPRIILTKSVEEMLTEIDKGFADQNFPNYITKFLYKDFDGLIFINYLKFINSRVSVHPPCLYPGSEAILAAISADETSALPGGSERLHSRDVPFVNELEKHKNKIIENLNKHNNEPHILEKYLWTANYHNNFCEHGYDKYSIDLAQYQMQPVVGFYPAWQE